MTARLLALMLFATPALAPPAADAVRASCIDSDRIQGREGESDRSILFHMQSGITWRNTLRGACPGLRDVGGFRILVTEQQGTRLCTGDLVRAVDPVVARSAGLRSGVACPLGDFTRAADTPHRRGRGGAASSAAK